MTEAEEKNIVELCKKGDRKAQKALYERFAPRMFPVCCRYVGQGQLAEDLLHDGFVTLFSKIGDFKGEGSFEGWARRIFVTTALMYLRKKDVLKISGDITEARGLSAPTASAVSNLGYQELMKLIANLPPGFRTIFNLYAIEGYSHKEIAQMLGISEVTSRSQLSRARALLQKEILGK